MWWGLSRQSLGNSQKFVCLLLLCYQGWKIERAVQSTPMKCYLLMFHCYFQSLWRSLSKDIILLGIEKGKTSHFFYFAAEQRLVLEVIVVLNVFETRSFAKTDVPLRSSKTTCNTSRGSCWELKSNGTLQISDILRLRAHRKFDGPIGFKSFFQMDILKVVTFEMGNVMEDSDGNLPQRIGTVLRTIH